MKRTMLLYSVSQLYWGNSTSKPQLLFLSQPILATRIYLLCSLKYSKLGHCANPRRYLKIDCIRPSGKLRENLGTPSSWIASAV